MEYVPALLKSKRFWVSLLGLLVIIISAFEPHLAERFNEIVPAVLVIVGFLVGGYSLEDAVTANNPPSTTIVDTSIPPQITVTTTTPQTPAAAS